MLSLLARFLSAIISASVSMCAGNRQTIRQHLRLFMRYNIHKRNIHDASVKSTGEAILKSIKTLFKNGYFFFLYLCISKIEFSLYDVCRYCSRRRVLTHMVVTFSSYHLTTCETIYVHNSKLFVTPKSDNRITAKTYKTSYSRCIVVGPLWLQIR
jgi:hypothetical protein